MSSTIMVETNDNSVAENATATATAVAQQRRCAAATQVPPSGKRPLVLIELFREYASLSDLLRYGGALSVVVAMALFLVEGARALTDIERFMTMLGFTGALTAAGFLMSLLLKEQRGSRVFVALAMLSVPINFTVFGALVYSFIPVDGMAVNYPGFAEWTVTGTQNIAMAIGAGLLVLTPVTWAGLTVLARSERKWLSIALIISCAALVVPVRQELIVAVIALLASCSSWWFMRKYGSESLVLKTPEGRFASALLFVSPLIIVARSLLLYEATGVLMLVLSGSLYIAARHLLSSRIQSNWFSVVLTMIAAIMCFGIGISVFAIGEALINAEYAALVASCVLLNVNYDLTRMSPSKRLAGTFGVFSVIVTVCLIVALALFEGGLALILSCVVVLTVVAGAAYLLGFPTASVIAVAGVSVIAIAFAEDIWSMAITTGWWGVAGLGVSAIVAGSLVDRMGTVVKGVEA